MRYFLRYFLTGGSGLLGKELQKYIICDAPSHKDIDITKIFSVNEHYEVIVHAAAYTNVVKAETDQEECFRVNVLGTQNVLKAFPRSKFIYISSEDVYRPVNWYSKTKLMAEQLVQRHPNYLIIRTAFTVRPFKYEMAFFDKYTREDYVDIIAPMIVTAILENKTGIVDIGTERKTLFELARRTKPKILGTTVKDAVIPLPDDYRLSSS